MHIKHSGQNLRRASCGTSTAEQPQKVHSALHMTTPEVLTLWCHVIIGCRALAG